MKTHEFEHYPGCGFNDPDNCSACALTDTRQESPNYSAWPLVYMANSRVIPAKWRKAFQRELTRTDNDLYVNNLKRHIKVYGVRFSDGQPLVLSSAATKAAAKAYRIANIQKVERYINHLDNLLNEGKITQNIHDKTVTDMNKEKNYD